MPDTPLNTPDDEIRDRSETATAPAPGEGTQKQEIANEAVQEEAAAERESERGYQ